MFVNTTPIPECGLEKTTRPIATNVAPSCSIRIQTFVPGGRGFAVLTRHPNRLKSLVRSRV